MPARDLAQLDAEVAAAKARFGLPADAPVVTCYEAGRDGVWLHRALTARGLASHVVDSASITENRRARRAKSDRLDAAALVRLLLRHHAGERGRGERTGDQQGRQRADPRAHRRAGVELGCDASRPAR
jgi:transposase